MPLKSTVPGANTKPPDVPHLALLTPLQPPWLAVKPGNWMGYGDGSAEPIKPMLLVSVEPSNYGLKMEFACCDNPKCTRRIKFEAKWNGRHEKLDGE
jgi:hypothetical protein